MTDEKLERLLCNALQSDETPPEIDLTAKRKPVRSKAPGVLAACACLWVCAAAYFGLGGFDGSSGATESANMVMDTAEKQSIATESAVEETTEAAEPAATTPAMGDDLCAYPKYQGSAEAVADHWMQFNAPGKVYELLADTERYTSYRVEIAEGEVLYLVIDKETLEPVSLEELLSRGNFAVDAQQVNMLYVNQEQELILVQGTEEICLGPIE